MLFSIGIIIILAILIKNIFKKINIPSVVGYIFLGIILGPSVLNILDKDLLKISVYLRQIALIIILTRAGLSLDLKSLKEVGRPAILLSFLPLCFEIIGVVLVFRYFLDITLVESLLLGAVIAAVSPAIIVPRMLTLLDKVKQKEVPLIVMCGASIDDVFAIVLFYAFLEMLEKKTINPYVFVEIPAKIILGIIIGVIVGYILTVFFKHFIKETIYQFLILLSVSFIIVYLEDITTFISFSAYLSVMTIAVIVLAKNKKDVLNIKKKYEQAWILFEIFLFVLVGALVDINVVFDYGLLPILLILIVLLFRSLGVYLSLLRTKLSFKERLFIIFSYLPKATVQASIGAIALTRNLNCGKMVLTFAVVSIIITAPLGAILIDSTKGLLLEFKEE